MRDDYYKKPVWVNVKLDRFTLGEIDDRYLLAILKFLVNGGGYIIYLSEEIIKVLFEEAKFRKLEHNYTVQSALDAYVSKNTIVNRIKCASAVRRIEARQQKRNYQRGLT